MASSMSNDCLIPAEPLLENFNCSVCLSMMNDVWVTSCLHRFCERCIKESINASHRCPLCNHPLQQDNVQRDAQFNSMLELIEKLIENAETKKAAKFADEVAEKVGDKSIRAILEELFRKTLVSSLANHLTSENEMQIRYKQKRAEIQQKYDRELTELQEKALPREEYERKKSEKLSCFHGEIEELEKEIRNVQKLFIEAYQNHLNENVSNFAAVPVQVRLTLWKENKLWKKRDRQYVVRLLHPEEKIENLLPSLHELAEAQNDKIVDFGQTIFFSLIDSFDDQSEEKIIERLKKIDLATDDDDSDNLLTVSRRSRPILEHKLLRGSLIVVHGEVLLDSEVPKKCFVQVFKENPSASHLVDYFCCFTCVKAGKELRWICRSCASSCHKQHDVKPLVFGNQASGPKCDCRKVCCLIPARN